MLALDLSRIRTAQERFEQVYQPEALRGGQRRLPGRRAGVAGVRHLQGQGAVSARRPGADDARAAVQPVPGAVRRGRSTRRSTCGISRTTPNTGRGRARDRRGRSDDGVLRERRDRPRPADAGAVLSVAADEAALPEDCQGLCPVCGTNLNRGTCTCNARLGRSAVRGAEEHSNERILRRCRIQNDDTRRRARPSAARTTR